MSASHIIRPKLPETGNLRAALAYAQRLGWPVFPCCWIADEGTCSCGKPDCGSPGKHPLTRQGFKEASRDEAQIQDWWTEWLLANIGVPTGSASGFDVLDVDPRHEGEKALAELERQHGRLPPTVEALTGGGGRHFLFRHQAGISNKAGFRPGLDVRGEGGYILVAPSLHASGLRYQWGSSAKPGEVELAQWPAWALPLLQKPLHEERVRPSPRASDGQGSLYGSAALQGEVEKVRHALPGQQETTLNGAAFSLGELVGAGELDYGEALESMVIAGCAMMSEEGRSPWTVEQVRKKVEHGLADGMKQPRKVGLRQPGPSLLAARKLAPVNSKTDHQTPDMGASLAGIDQLTAPIGDRGQQTARYTRQTPASLRKSYRPTEWTVDSLLPFPGVGLMAGIPGIGKTWLSLLFALAVATGKPLWGRFQARQGPVLLVLEEEDENSIVERLGLLYGPLGLSQAEGDALPIHFLVQQGVQLATPGGQLDPELVRHIGEVKPALICLDPFRRAHGLDENDSGQMSALFNLLRQLTRHPEHPCSLLLVHHLRKRSPHAEDALDRLRGSSDIAASVDSVLGISGTFPTLVARHSKSKRGPSLGGFLIQGSATPEGVNLRYVDQDQKVSADRERLRTWLTESLRKAGKPVSQTELVKAGETLKFSKDRIRQLCKSLEEDGAVNSTKGPRNSLLYTLRDQFAEGGAGGSENYSEPVELEEIEL